MPERIPRPCRHPACSDLTTERHGYCEAHKHHNWKMYQGNRGDRHRRGYGSKWEKIRELVMQRDSYLCQPCKRQGRVIKAVMVDHIQCKAKGGTDDLSNLEAICGPCNKKKTARQDSKK